MATSPQFAATPLVGAVQISTADTSLTAPTSAGVVVTAGSSGSRIDEVVVLAPATVAAGLVRLFLYNGTSYFLWREVAVTATTPSTTVAAFTSSVRNDTRSDLALLVLPSGWSLRATTTIAQTINVFATVAGSF